MNSADYRVTSLLTEHLGFAPLTLIDEVINDVNQIMYNCTDALERFLMKRRAAQLQQLGKPTDNDGDGDVLMDGTTQPEAAGVFPAEEIRLGAAELETLLVSHVDKNFDKFELYTLRNIFTMPRDLVEGGWIRLKHQENVTADSVGKGSGDVDEVIKPLVDSINLELQLRKMLLLHKVKAGKIVELLRHYKRCVIAVTQAGAELKLLPEAATILKDLQPMNENVYYLLGQVDELLKQVLRLNDKFMKDEQVNGLRNMKFGASLRDRYIRDKSLKILDEIGVLGSDVGGKVLYSAYAQ